MLRIYGHRPSLASSVGVNGIDTDLSLVGSLTGEFVETRHIMVIDPIGSACQRIGHVDWVMKHDGTIG